MSGWTAMRSEYPHGKRGAMLSCIKGVTSRGSASTPTNAINYQRPDWMCRRSPERIGELFTLALSDQDARALEHEVVPRELKIYITRLLRRGRPSGEDSFPIVWDNRVINKARSISSLPIYVLKSDDMGEYHPAEVAWHNGEFEVCVRRLDAIEFIEFLCECVEEDWLDLQAINSTLERANVSFRLNRTDVFTGTVAAEVLNVTDLDRVAREVSHPNVRALIARMDVSLQEGDYPAVLHASASIFEALAKEIVGIPTVQDQTLAGFFDRYRQNSHLPLPVLDYILEIYRRRNVEPIAGHGNLAIPTISRAEAQILSVMTKAFLTYEKQSHLETVHLNEVRDH